MSFQPWRRLRELAHITLLWHDGEPFGVTDFEAGTISLQRGMSYEQRRCTLLHEVQHVYRGPMPPGLEDKDELEIDSTVARLLLPDLAVVADAVAYHDHDLDAAAWELAVDTATLRLRLTRLHPSERHWLTNRFAD